MSDSGLSIVGGAGGFSDTYGTTVTGGSNTYSAASNGAGDASAYLGTAGAINTNGATQTSAGSAVTANPYSTFAAGAQQASSQGLNGNTNSTSLDASVSDGQSASNLSTAVGSVGNGTSTSNSTGATSAMNGTAKAGGASAVTSKGDNVKAGTDSVSNAQSKQMSWEEMCKSVEKFAKASLDTQANASGGENSATASSSSTGTAAPGQALASGGSQGVSFAHGFQHVDGKTDFSGSASKGGSLSGASSTSNNAVPWDPTLVSQGQVAAYW